MYLMKNIRLWGWDKKPRTMLRYIKVGDIVCFEINSSGDKFGYGQIIAELSTGRAFRTFNIIHSDPMDITIDEIENSNQFGKTFVLDAYGTLDDKKLIQNGEWRIIGRQENFELTEDEINNVFFEYGNKGMKQKKNLLNQNVSISDAEAENYVSSGPVTGDQAKIWYLKYDE